PSSLAQPPMDGSSDEAHISEEPRSEHWEVVQDLEVRPWHHVRHHPTPPEDAEPLEKFSYGLIIKGPQMGEFIGALKGFVLPEVFLPGHHGKECPVRLQDARDLLDDRLHVQNMLQDIGADHHVEGARLERQLLSIPDDGPMSVLAGDAHVGLRQVNAG